MREKILHSIDRCIEVVGELREGLAFIEGVAELIATRYRGGNKVLLAGNGGSLCEAMHFSEELTGYFRKERPPIPAIALADPGHLTCVGNDVGFDRIFSRGVEALGKEGDLFICLTTSGNSQNIRYGVDAAKGMGMMTAAFLGKDGGALRGICDLEWIVEGSGLSARIQEAHLMAIHIIIERVEEDLFPEHGS